MNIQRDRQRWHLRHAVLADVECSASSINAELLHSWSRILTLVQERSQYNYAIFITLERLLNPRVTQI